MTIIASVNGSDNRVTGMTAEPEATVAARLRPQEPDVQQETTAAARLRTQDTGGK